MRSHPTPFHPNAAFTALRPFTLNGKDIKPGDPVDLSEVPMVRREKLFQARFMQVSDSAPRARKPKGEASMPSTAKEASPEAQDVPPTGEAQPAADPVGPLKAVHRGFGRWFVVDATDKDVAGPLTKEEATAKATPQT